MAEFKLGRIRFVWKGAWAATTTYYIDDVVRYGGRTYICSVGHTSSADFNTDLEYNPTKWNQMSDGQEWKGDWTISTFYKLNDLVKYGGMIYICVDSHSSAATPGAGLEADQAKWQLFAEGFDWKGVWAISIRYKVNDIVRYGGYTYICNTGHTSAATAASGLEADQSKWDTFNQGIEYKGTWAAATRYKANDVVKYGAGLWICTTQHTSVGDFITNLADWAQFVEGTEFEDTWNSSTVYQPGDIVKYGGNQYIAKTVHSNGTPSTSTTNWDLYLKGFSYTSDWAITTSYKIGEVVRLNGQTYIASVDAPSLTLSVTSTDNSSANFIVADTTGLVVNTAIVFASSIGGVNAGATYYIKQVVNSTNFRISTTPGGAVFSPTTATGPVTVNVAAKPPMSSYWTLLSSGMNWRGLWTDDVEYVIGDTVRYGSNAYICVLAHRSESDDGSSIKTEGGGAANSRPDLDNTGTYWNALSIGSDTSVLTTKGDLVYYAESGPTRLPIGIEGQVLRAGEEIPEWVTLGQTDHVYYVAPQGTDLPAPVWGLTDDKPWKTIRYACEQVEDGPRNPNAKYLLEMNRVFIQREITSWVDYQISTATPGSTFDGFTYDDARCERDTGLIVDALTYDISHGGNVKSRGAALAYVGGLVEESPGPYIRLAQEKVADVAAFTYMLSLVEDVLNQDIPATIYQSVVDDSTAIADQFFDTTRVAEPGVMTTITGLVGIITDAITAGNDNNIPARVSPNNLIKVSTGVFRETLPIIVPEQTAVQGDELRSTNAGPAGSLTHTSDTKYSLGALTRLEAIIGDIVKGNNVVETAGNTETQSSEWPFADTAEKDYAENLVRMMKHRIDFGTGNMDLASYPNPTGYNVSYLTGYGDARYLLKENKEFIQREIIAFITANYSTIKYSKTKCKQDVGYIIDALIYDLTYGGYSQTLNAGLAYFDGPGSSLMIDSTELTATIASYTRLKTVIQQVIANTTVTKSAVYNESQFTDSDRSGGSAASSFVGANIDLVTAILTGGSTSYGPTVTVTSVVSTNVAVTGSAHGLEAGDTFTPRSTANGFVSGTMYYVLTTPSSTQFTVSTSFQGTTSTLTNGTGLSIVGDVVNTPATSWVSSPLTNAFLALSAAKATIVSNTTSYITTNYPTLVYNSAKCERDVRLILDAVGYDFMFASNFQSIKAAYAYLRQSASDVFNNDQKAATRAAFEYVRTQAIANVGGNTTAQARVTTLMRIIDSIIWGATDEGSSCVTEARNSHYAVLQLERNRDYIVAEVNAYIAATYTATVTNTTTTTNVITIADTGWLQRNAAVRFTGTTFGGIQANTTYYVQNVVSSTQFTIATTRNSNTELALSTAAGSCTVALYYDTARCTRDINKYIDAVKYDIKNPGNYKSRFAARYYVNSVKGSLEEDMFYLRDSTGIRDMTLQGLSGDLTSVNAYGTSRVSAGAYVSLDPGWGPDDFRTWIITRSPYVQGVSTFGTACIGQKIDGALHNGGNDSITSNDFTQVLSDGIGAWVANNGRAELVSVFTYYCHIGYLSTEGGRIRGTNGNCSYGDFGAVAEGFDDRETPNTAVVDNKFQFESTVGSVLTDGDAVYQFEFDNAGIDYTKVAWTITGGGAQAAVEANEFRDDAVFQVRMLDFGDDSSGQFGGAGYLSNANTAQGGTGTSLTLAATDSEVSSAYVGMKVLLTGGAGVGQYGIITSYNAGTKIASVVKETTGAAGWDHVVPGMAIATPDASTTYVIEPALSFSHPGFTSSTGTMSSSISWSSAVYGETTGAYTSLSGTYSGSGASGALFSVIRNGWKYFVTTQNAGIGYTRLETITIPGTSLGGLSPTNDVVITITAVSSTTGAIQAYDVEGYGCGGRFVAVGGTSNNTGSYSDNGSTWTSMTLPTTGNWSAVAHGLIDDGSTVQKVSRFVAVRTGSNAAAYSADGITWTATTMPSSASWTSIAYGNGRFVAVNSSGTQVAVSFDGQTWDVTGTGTVGYSSVTYGAGKFVALATGTTTAAASSTDGITWTARTLPASSTWVSVTHGNNLFVAVASDSNSGAYSKDGITWTAMTIGSADGSTVGGYQQVRYGQGVYMATTYQAGVEDYSFVATSENGVTWTIRGVDATPNTMSGYRALAFGNPHRTGYWVAIQFASGNTAVRIRTGARAKARAYVAEEKIFSVRIVEPGSGYDTAPTMTITDPNNIYEAQFSVRKGKGVISQPNWVNRGIGYTTGSAEVDTGDGYADNYQSGSFVVVRRLSQRPVSGSNVVFSNLPNRTFKLVNVFTFLGSYDGSYTAYFQVSPSLSISEAPEHLDSVTTRIRYSQVRLTGHDFLDIGTGNLTETNYPNTPTQDPIPANETVENNGGRVFFTATDQDGNFRVGDLFSIEQSTGIATLNADAFNISGLQELNLGNVTLGGGSATITEFSTDPFFTADSDNVVPTQRAIKAYIAAQIGGGGASLNVNSVTAGSIKIDSNQITNITGGVIKMKATFEFRGGLKGYPIAWNYFLT